MTIDLLLSGYRSILTLFTSQLHVARSIGPELSRRGGPARLDLRARSAYNLLHGLPVTHRHRIAKAGRLEPRLHFLPDPGGLPARPRRHGRGGDQFPGAGAGDRAAGRGRAACRRAGGGAAHAGTPGARRAGFDHPFPAAVPSRPAAGVEPRRGARHRTTARRTPRRTGARLAFFRAALRRTGRAQAAAALPLDVPRRVRPRQPSAPARRPPLCRSHWRDLWA